MPRIEYFMNALGYALPEYTSIDTTLPAPDPAQDARAAQLFNKMLASPDHLGHHLSDIRLVVLRNDSARDLSQHERIAVHEFGHTQVVRVDEIVSDNDGLTVRAFRYGYNPRPASQGSWLSEADAEWRASHYIRATGQAAVLPHELTKSAEGFILPGHFGLSRTETAGNALAAIGLELLFAKDPALLDMHAEGTKKLSAHLEACSRIESLAPGLFSYLSSLDNDGDSMTAGLRRIIDDLYAGDDNATWRFTETHSEKFYDAKLAEHAKRTGRTILDFA
jgi:hypothetical protein